MIYVYAVAEDLADIADLTGVQGEPLILVPFGDASAVVGEVGARPSIDPGVLRAQDEVVRTLHDRSRALLPMRFGTTSRDRAEILRLLEAHENLRSRLAAVRGCEQMVVRVLGAAAQIDAPVVNAATGTEYLRERAKRHQPAPALEALARSMGDLTRDVRIEVASQAGLVGAVYHLIDRGRSKEYRLAVDRLVRDLPGIRVLVTGPSPAYAFA